MSNYPKSPDGVVRLRRGRDAAIRRGHPWIFEGAIAELEGSPISGDVVEVVDDAGGFIAWAFYSESSQIRARCVSRTKEAFPDEAWVRDCLHRAWRMRRRHGFVASHGVRVVNAEGDHLPGLIVDLYGSVASVQFHHPWAERYRETIRAFALDDLAASAVIDRSQRAARLHEGLAQSQGLMFGAYDDHPVIQEHGVTFVVDARNGQKTGFYLDQRANRALIGRWAAGRRVLDLFAYTGGFGLAALAAGAQHATFVESGSSAVELLRRNLDVNRIAEGRYELVHDQVDRFLAATAERYDLIVVDPPPMARRKVHATAALRGMGSQLGMTLRRAAPDALLMIFSCSHSLGGAALAAALGVAAVAAGRRVQVLQELGADADHPWAAGHPEGRYLSGLLVCLGDGP